MFFIRTIYTQYITNTSRTLTNLLIVDYVVGEDRDNHKRFAWVFPSISY